MAYWESVSWAEGVGTAKCRRYEAYGLFEFRHPGILSSCPTSVISLGASRGATIFGVRRAAVAEVAAHAVRGGVRESEVLDRNVQGPRPAPGLSREWFLGQRWQSLISHCLQLGIH